MANHEFVLAEETEHTEAKELLYQISETSTNIKVNLKPEPRDKIDNKVSDV